MTTKPKHTSGPWVIVNEEAETVEIAADDKTKYHRLIQIGLIYPRFQYPGEALANARLIAASPELLEACKALVDYADNLDEDGEPNEEEIEAFENVYNKCVKAIAKAETV